MGNSPPTGLRPNNGDRPCQLLLGLSAGLIFSGRNIERHSDGEINESWVMQYQVNMSTCSFVLTKTIGSSMSPHHDEKLEIIISEDTHGISFIVTVQKAEVDLLHPSSISHSQMSFIAIISNALGGITETSVEIYGSGGWKGLVVREWKRRSKGEKPYMGTVAHYYANAENGNDVGLSVVIKKIRVSHDGHFDFAVDGPEQHPVHALFYMFDEVLRTGTWKPTYCPHCANNIIQRHRISWQSESEDSDIDNVPSALPRGRRQNAGGILANDGRFRGNNNGSSTSTILSLDVEEDNFTY